MSKASVLRQLADEDLEAIHHLIRRDAMSDLEIAREAELRFRKTRGKRDGETRGQADGDAEKESQDGQGGAISLGPTDAARAMAIARYRASEPYRRWLQNWEGRHAELRKAIETQKQRFEFISKLVAGSSSGLEAVSNGLMARLLTLATEMSDDELKEAAAGQGGWVAKIIRAQQEQAKCERLSLGKQAAGVVADAKMKPEERQARIREIFGLK